MGTPSYEYAKFAKIYPDTGRYTDEICARFIIGSEITRWDTLPSSLPPWNLSFSRLQISDMRFKKATGA
ncbi:hypothetical protein D3C74_204190 [compost metagenome]